MLKSENQIRLTSKEINLLTSLSGSDASNIKTVKHLHDFINAHLTKYSKLSAEERLLRKLMEKFLIE